MGPGDERPDKVEVGIFGGGRFFQQVDKGLGTKHSNGGVIGYRFNVNFWKYVGIEHTMGYGPSNVMFMSPAKAGQPNFGFGSRLYAWSLGPVVHWTPRGSRIRPYLTAAVAADNYTVTDQAKAEARMNSQYGAQNLQGKTEVGLQYGGGVKFHMTDRFGMNVDVRGLLSRNPTYGLPDFSTSTVYIPRNDKLNGVQTTVGLTWYLGKKAEPLPVAEPPKPPQPLRDLNGGSITGGTGTLCQGRPITVRTDASDPDGRRLTYKWKVNGQPMGSSTPELTFTPDRAGSYLIELDVEAENTAGMPVRVAKGKSLSLSVQEYRAPTITGCRATPAVLSYGQTSSLSASVTGSACSTTSLQWTASEGTVGNPTSPNATFDSKSVRFEQGGKIQSKTVTVTGRVTDDRGMSANCSLQIKVDYVPEAIRFSDVIFSKGSARVNNCGKRILLEELAPKASDPDYEVILIGHFDNDETPKGKVRKTLDQERIENVVAVLTGGTGTCAKLDASRVKVDWTGATQTSAFQPGLCGTSTRSAAGERRGSMVSTADQNRRVEIWLVPKGTKLPAAFSGAKELDAKTMKKLGCPK
jgi:outer membrane protein OmpA-like peptidoglycan-associated protein/opacity protein-like surface antigen